jgi:phenylacetate-CoA ligase
MENLIVEIVVRDDGGAERPARPGEVGEVVITDLHNLGMPFIRYLNGDLATARSRETCGCGRGLARIGSVEGRVTEALRDGHGNRVNGLIFNLIVCDLADVAREFQAVQRTDGSITLELVPSAAMNERALARVREHCETYLPGTTVRIALVDEIPRSAAGKRQVVFVEQPAKGGLDETGST